MPNPCDLAEESGVLDDVITSTVIDVVAADSATLDDGHAHAVSSNTVEAAVLDDTVEERATLEVVESATLNDAVQTSSTFETNVVEAARIGDGEMAVLGDNVVEEAELGEAVVQRVESNLVEAAALGDAVAVGGTFATDVVEAATLGDVVRDGVPALVVEEGALGDAVETSCRLADAVVESAALGDGVQVGSTVTTEATEAAVLGDAYADHLSGSNSVVEVGYLDDVALGGGNAAWRTHVEPWAMSRYTNAPWNSMAVIDGVLFAAGPEGVYQLDGADDAGANIEAELVHDWLNWAPDRRGQPAPNHHLKRPRYLYLNEVKADGALAVALGYVTMDGAKSESEYPLPDTAATGFVNIRVPLGRGIRSQHLRPTIRNVDGADFEFGNGRLAVDSLARNL
jgi:hypothetical protein